MKNRLVCHLIANYPDFDQSLKIAESFAAGGAESIEIQFPFSDPSADGPYILKACDKALKAGFTVEKGFSLVEKIIKKTKLNVYIMSYANILLTCGIENFVKRSKAIGVQGLIIPDLTLNNDDGLLNAGRKYGISIIPVVTLTTPLKRVDEILAQRPKYIYAVLRKGITGESTVISKDNITFLKYLSGKGVKIFGGFGINSREQVKKLSPHLYASVAGTVFVKMIDENGKDLPLSLKTLVSSLIDSK
ncbi:MAG: tryptophan synthase subunit alpha [Spirochaetales bacterium]|nr:tryptophan synthase subunit alpha [Spirochaetales bacterium]